MNIVGEIDRPRRLIFMFKISMLFLLKILTLLSSVLYFQQIAFAQNICDQPGASCVPIQTTPYRYLAYYSPYFATGKWYDSSGDAYNDLVALAKSSYCYISSTGLSEFTPAVMLPDEEIFATFTTTLSTIGPSDPMCGHYLTGPVTGYVEGVRTISCPLGTKYHYLSTGSVCISQAVETLQISSTSPIIPADMRTTNGYVYTTSVVSLKVSQGGQPVSGLQIQLQSNRGHPTDGITQPAPTDANGQARAVGQTYTQPGPSIISVTVPSTLQGSTTISWLPARYENSFLVTCYVLALESSAPPQPTSTNVCGLPQQNAYRTQFLNAVRMQGSGQALDGTIIHYSGHGCYNTDTCARTANGTCARVGTTIATDPEVIPRGSTVAIDTLGSRVAQDGGGWINGYHIDDYMGTQLTQCQQLGRRNLGATFQRY